MIFSRFRSDTPRPLHSPLCPDFPDSDSGLSVSREQIREIWGCRRSGTLKLIAHRPELIDPYDTDAPDPFTIVELRNTGNGRRNVANFKLQKKKVEE
jgi:hypothetical protein